MIGHSFLIEKLGELLANLEAKGYQRSESSPWLSYSKTLSEALTKTYSFLENALKVDEPVQIRVTYKLLNNAKPLQKLMRRLKQLNQNFRSSSDELKTKRKISKEVRLRRWEDVQRFLRVHGELVSCFKYEGDDRLTEGNHSFNLRVATTAKEQQICLEFIKVLAEALNPNELVRGRRQADKPVQQRNGWIKREATNLKKRGWRSADIARVIQKDLRNGTWNERSRLQYNIANSTICKIAGLKIPHTFHPN